MTTAKLHIITGNVSLSVRRLKVKQQKARTQTAQIKVAVGMRFLNCEVIPTYVYSASEQQGLLVLHVISLFVNKTGNANFCPVDTCYWNMNPVVWLFFRI